MDNLSPTALAVGNGTCYNASRMSFYLSVFFTLFLIDPVSASTGGSMVLAKQVLKKYQVASGVRLELNKKTTMALLGESQEAKGRLIMASGQLRLETDAPSESLIVVTKNIVWVVTPTPPDLGGRPQVLKIRSKSAKDQARAPLAALFGKSAAWEQLKLKSESQKGERLSLVLVPKKPGAWGDLTQLELEINTKSRELLQVAYSDELENETRFSFTATDFKSKIKGTSFQYKPPSNADLTEY
jgi:outer membrane lipoprotein-sorting protein